MILTHLLFAVVLCYQSVSCSKKLCNIEDHECVTAAVKKIKYKSLTALHVDLIEANQKTVKYILRNTTLSGLIDCTPELLKINLKDMTYDYHLACEQLHLQGLYEVNGELGPMHIEGKGDFNVDYSDYLFLFNGHFEQYFDADKKLHNYVKNFKLNLDPRGKVVFDFKNLFNGDSEKVAELQKYVFENREIVNTIMRLPVMEKFMPLLFEKINDYLAKEPNEYIFTAD